MPCRGGGLNYLSLMFFLNMDHDIQLFFYPTYHKTAVSRAQRDQGSLQLTSGPCQIVKAVVKDCMQYT